MSFQFELLFQSSLFNYSPGSIFINLIFFLSFVIFFDRQSSKDGESVKVSIKGTAPLSKNWSGKFNKKKNDFPNLKNFKE